MMYNNISSFGSHRCDRQRRRQSSLALMMTSLKWCIGIASIYMLVFSFWLIRFVEFPSHQELLVTTTSSSFGSSDLQRSSSSLETIVLSKKQRQHLQQQQFHPKPKEDTEEQKQGKQESLSSLEKQYGSEPTMALFPHYNTQSKLDKTKNIPKFVFHIGIPKSGTTSIQCGLAKLSKELASQESYYFIGKPCPEQGLENLGNNETPVNGHWLPQELDKGKLGNIGAKLNATLQRHLRHDDGRTSTTGIIFSSEVFATDKWKADQPGFDLLKSMLKGYSVRIVVGYRRYFEWLPSFIYQEIILPTFIYQQDALQPSQHSMVELIRGLLNTTATTLHMTTRAIKIWSAQFDDVYVFNMNQEGDLVTNFVCQALPGHLTNTCRNQSLVGSWALNNTASHHERSPEKDSWNTSEEINWLRLVAAARRLGWNATQQEWNNSRALYETFQTTHPVEYQSLLSCLTGEEREKLLNLSLAMEKELVAIATASGNNKHLEELLLPSKLEQHRKTFYEHVHKGKHCEVDVFRALSNTSSLFVRYVFPNLDNQISIHNSSFIRDVSTEKITTKPYFVFHIGIPKSGTTTIQCGLTKLSGELASQDSYYYIGKQCAWQGVKHGLKNGETPFDAHTLAARLSQGKMEGILKTLNATLNRHLHRQVGGSTAGIVLSSENMVTYRFQTRQSTFDFLKGLLEGYSVRIVIGYRRYFEWMPSLFYQYNLQEPLAQSYVEYIRRKLNTTTSHMTTDATRKWNAQFEDVYVFNMHQDGDLVTNFVCQALPGPPTNVCRKESTALSNTTIEARKALNMDFIRLVAAARELGWNMSKENWKNTKPLYETFQTTHPVEYQSLLSCLTEDEQEKLLNLSLAYEKELVATATANGNNKHLEELLLPSKLEEHREKFYEHVRKGKFCEFEAVRALSNTSSLFVRYVFPNFATAR